MKKALIFRNELLPISETFIRAQASALKNFSAQYAGLRLSPRRLPLPEDAIVLTSDDGRQGRLLELLYKFTGFGPIFRKRVSDARPSVIHAHFALDGANTLPLVEDTSAPLVVTLHGYDVTTRDSVFRAKPGGERYLQQRPKLWRSASAFICVSDFIRRKAIEQGFPEHKLQVHNIGIDCEAFTPSDKQRQNNLVLFVGRLVEKKDASTLSGQWLNFRSSEWTRNWLSLETGHCGNRWRL